MEPSAEPAIDAVLSQSHALASGGSEADGREVVAEHDLACEVLRGEGAPLIRLLGRHRRDVMREHECPNAGAVGGARRVLDG
jgi:hypothetical protein